MTEASLYYEPTEDEKDSMNRAGLIAAWNELQSLSNEAGNDDYDHSDGILVFLRAFKAAEQATKSAEQSLLNEKHGYKRIHYYPLIEHIVCSALYGLPLDPRRREFSPYSIGGSQIMMLIGAVKALEAISDLESAIEDGSVVGTYLAEKAVHFAEAQLNNSRNGNDTD